MGDATIVITSIDRQVEAFLTYECELLDEWRLDEWLQLFTDDCLYVVPSTDRPDGDPDTDLFFIRDDHFLLSQRVDAMLNGSAWAESPHSTTLRMISNVRAHERPDGEIDAKANFVVHRSRRDRLDVYPGTLKLRLVPGGAGGFQIKRRTAVLAIEQLRPHGRVSVLL